MGALRSARMGVLLDRRNLSHFSVPHPTSCSVKGVSSLVILSPDCCNQWYLPLNGITIVEKNEKQQTVDPGLDNRWISIREPMTRSGINASQVNEIAQILQLFEKQSNERK